MQKRTQSGSKQPRTRKITQTKGSRYILFSEETKRIVGHCGRANLSALIHRNSSIFSTAISVWLAQPIHQLFENINPNGPCSHAGEAPRRLAVIQPASSSPPETNNAKQTQDPSMCLKTEPAGNCKSKRLTRPLRDFAPFGNSAMCSRMKASSGRAA